MSTEATPEKPPSAFLLALKQAQLDIQPLPKDASGYSGSELFRYTSAEALIDAARSALLSNGMIAYRYQWSITYAPTETGPDYAIITSYVSLIHIDTGECWSVKLENIARASHGVPLEKSVSTVLTTSLAYWLRDLLLIPRYHVEPEATTPETTAASATGKAYSTALSAVSRCTTQQQLSELTLKIRNSTLLNDTEKQNLFACLRTKTQELAGPGGET